MNAAPPISRRPTTHACARYAQRVLGMQVGELDILGNPALRGRCARGIERLLQRARSSSRAGAWSR